MVSDSALKDLIRFPRVRNVAGCYNMDHMDLII